MLSGIFAICAQIRKLPRSFLYVRKYLNIFSQKMSKWLRIQIKIYLSRMFFYAQSTGTVYYMGNGHGHPVSYSQIYNKSKSSIKSTLLSSHRCCPVNSAV